MTSRRTRPVDVLGAGELLIDFLSADFADSFDSVSSFKRIQGGSPANWCMNMARLGNNARLAATVGQDDMGDFLVNTVARTGVDTSPIRRVAMPSTLILVTRSKNVSNFEAYRMADSEIDSSQLPDELWPQLTLFHTTCFGISRQPAQGAIIAAARKAAAAGCQLSLDANYAAKIWPDQAEAQALVREFAQLGALIKVSEVDWERLYNHPMKDPERAAAFFLDLGAGEACITMGGEGCLAGSSKGGMHFISGRKVPVKDTTGAGDAFWSGYITAWLDGHTPENCARAGRNMAELKLSVFGPLPDKVDRAVIYADLA
ncbi:MAG: carbohydrate kinase [Lewinellaceae bacterium]|nr:carbohydrate kinase [Lewinellaceae bacterium]